MVSKSKRILTASFMACALLGGVNLLSACTATTTQESTGQYIDSSSVTMKVKTQLLADEGVKGLPITVKTYKNVVQLSGFVDTLQQKQRAVEIARNVPGVRAVRDSIIVK